MSGPRPYAELYSERLAEVVSAGTDGPPASADHTPHTHRWQAAGLYEADRWITLEEGGRPVRAENPEHRIAALCTCGATCSFVVADVAGVVLSP